MSEALTTYTRITAGEAFVRNLDRAAKQRLDVDGVRRAYHEDSQTYWDVEVQAVHDEDVIAAIRLALTVDRDAAQSLRVVQLLVGEAPRTLDTNRGGVELLLRLVREDRLKLEVSGG